MKNNIVKSPWIKNKLTDIRRHKMITLNELAIEIGISFVTLNKSMNDWSNCSPIVQRKVVVFIKKWLEEMSHG